MTVITKRLPTHTPTIDSGSDRARIRDMRQTHADHRVHTLPSLVLCGIRDASLQLRTDTDRETLRRLSRLILRARHAGHDTIAIMPDYVACVAGAISRDVDRNETMKDVDAILRSFSTLSFPCTTTFEPSVGRPASPADLIDPVEAWIEERIAAEHREPAVAGRDIEAEVARLKALHPRVGLSYGYIGNCSNTSDDRGFMVFTDVVFADGSRGSSTRFGDHPYAELSKLRTMVLARLEGWVQDIEAKLEDGTMRSRSTHGLHDLRAAA